MKICPISNVHYLSSHTPQRKSKKIKIKNVCVPVPRSDWLIICRWAAEGFQSVEVPPPLARSAYD